MFSWFSPNSNNNNNNTENKGNDNDNEKTNSVKKESTSWDWNSVTQSLSQAVNITKEASLDFLSAFTEQQVENEPQQNFYPAPWGGLQNEIPDKERRLELKKRILTLSTDKNTFLKNPPSEAKFEIDHESWMPVALVVLKADKNLRDIRFLLVPQSIPESRFWRNYWYNVSLVKQSYGIFDDYSKPPKKSQIIAPPVAICSNNNSITPNNSNNPHKDSSVTVTTNSSNTNTSTNSNTNINTNSNIAATPPTPTTTTTTLQNKNNSTPLSSTPPIPKLIEEKPSPQEVELVSEWDDDKLLEKLAGEVSSIEITDNDWNTDWEKEFKEELGSP